MNDGPVRRNKVIIVWSEAQNRMNHTSHGPEVVSYDDWCVAEAARINKAGTPCRVARRHGRCAVVRMD